MKAELMNPMKGKLLHFASSKRLSLDDETRPSFTPRANDPFLEATNPDLNAQLVKQLR